MQAKMMGGGKKSSAGPTTGSVKNGAASPSGSQPNKRVEKQSFVNPNAGDPLENVDDDEK